MKSAITTTSWPKHLVKSVDTRKRDLVIRIADWTRDRDEPAFDVEIYNHGVYNWNESKTFCTKNANKTVEQARREAKEFAVSKLNSLLS